MADIAYRTGTPNSTFNFGMEGASTRDGMGIAFYPIQALDFTVSSLVVAFAHRNKSGGGHGDVSSISCYITNVDPYGTSAFPAAVDTADNTILSTDVASYLYGVYDGTFSLHTFNFSTQPTLTGGNWIIIRQTAVTWGYTTTVCWSPPGGTASSSGTGETRLRVIVGGTPDWQKFSSVRHYVYVYGVFIIPRDPDRPDADLITFPPDRPAAYDPDLPWLPGEWVGDVYTDPDWGTSSDYSATGGGRWGQNLVAAGHNLIYYEAFP